MSRLNPKLVRAALVALLALTLTACNLSNQPPTQTPVPPTPTEAATATPTLPPATITPQPSPTPSFAVAPFDPAPNPNIPRRLASSATDTLYAAPGGAGAVFFAASPVDPNDFAFIDGFGTLTVVQNGARSGLPAPFTSFGASSRETNDKLATSVAWSPDGNSVAVIIDNPARRDANEGVWVWTLNAGINQVLRNCRAGTPNCVNFVTANGAPANWYATSIGWSPDNQRLIARLMLEDSGREGFVVLSRTSDPNFRPPVCAYEYSNWTLDGMRVVVSGRDANNQMSFGTVIPDTCTDYLATPAALQGNLILMHATQALDGRLVAIGRQGSAFGSMYIYDQNGVQITPELGTARPDVVQWNADRDAVWVRSTSGGRIYVGELGGSVVEISSWSKSRPPTP
ncbi:MAG: hypothetical protein MUC99_10460 [Anaerolineae bacterium]|nr:hypothetical protein [Anaerolineae bacterium]